MTMTIENPLIIDASEKPFSEDPILSGLNRLLAEGYGLPPCGRYAKCSGGLINETYDVGGIWIAQRVNPIFGAAVNGDIAALTPHLLSGGIPVPRLCRSRAGTYSVLGQDYGLGEGNFRVMTKLPGTSIDCVADIAQIRALARMLASFHGALRDVGHVFAHARPGVHDFFRHKSAFDEALAAKRDHRKYAEMLDLRGRAEKMEKWIDIEAACGGPRRIIHGDPKLSNFLFETHDSAAGDRITGVIDLDTMARSAVSFDVGDAVRSWCNPRKEDEEPEFNSEYAREVLGEYEEGAQDLTRGDRAGLRFAPPYISLELALRFARDALCEDYFGFDPAIGHAEHSARRAWAMLRLCGQMLMSQTREI